MLNVKSRSKSAAVSCMSKCSQLIVLPYARKGGLFPLVGITRDARLRRTVEGDEAGRGLSLPFLRRPSR